MVNNCRRVGVILINTYKDMTSGEKRSLTLSMKKYADAFAKKYEDNLSGFASEADVIDTFYAEWLQDSLDSHYAWCSEKNEDSAGYTVKGYHEQDGFEAETKTKIRGILAEKIDWTSVQNKQTKQPVAPKQEEKAPVKEETGKQAEAKKVDASANRRIKRKNTTKLGRNDSCPCGSGKKYKKCCLENGVEYTYVKGKFVAVS
ncbi:Uncharacterized protein BN1090_A2_03576 [Aneurinibacillus migulanus]|nr:Uncharacterized protein BN1090_A2_03576 [Aneurinibacillus migulanus]